MTPDDEIHATFLQGKALIESPEGAVEGVRLIQIAAIRGYPPAMAMLGRLYSEANSVDFSEKQALHWSTRAAVAGDPSGKFQLAMHLERGWGTARNLEAALGLYIEAINAGVLEAAGSIGLAYLHGEGVVSSEATALQWFLRGAMSGDAFCQRQAAHLLRCASTLARAPERSRFWLERAAAQGDSFALFDLACYCVAGYGGAKDMFRAEILFRRARVHGGTRTPAGQWISALHGSVDHGNRVSSSGASRLADSACADLPEVNQILDRVVAFVNKSSRA